MFGGNPVERIYCELSPALNISLHALVTNTKWKRAILQRLEEQQQTFPTVLKWNQEDVDNPDIPTTLLYCRLVVQLEVLQTQFFIRRLIHLHDAQPEDEGNLLVTTFAMLSLTLSVWIDRDRFTNGGMRRNFSWFVSVNPCRVWCSSR